MSNRGRFGKYGEHKRMERLRQTRTRPSGVRRQGGPSALVARFQTTHTARNPQVAIRTAGTPDTGFIRSLSRRAFEQYGPYEEMLPEWFLAGIGLAFVAVLRKRPAGFAILERSGDECAYLRISELLAIAVEPWARNQGVGDRLMEEIIRRAEMLLVDKLILHTAVDNLPGQALFRKHGFVPCGIEKEFYPEGQDALMMERAKT